MLSIKNIRHSYGTTLTLENFSLDIQQGEIVCLLGPSGCGKTTLLRILAGLESPLDGDIQIDSQSIIQLPTFQRMFGLMFQDFALFPHLNVQENILFGLKMQKYPHQRQEGRLLEVLRLVGLEHLATRNVAELSGGEQQRVALARSLAPHPRLLMLDEPLGSLDAALKGQLSVNLRHIIKQAGITSIYVTHDQHEAFSIGDRIVVMNAGRIEQVDTPRALYLNPRSEFVAHFLELANILPIDIYEEYFLRRRAVDLPDPAGHQRPANVLLHPERLNPMMRQPIDARFTGVQAEVQQVVFQGGVYRVVSSVEGTSYRLTTRFPVTVDIPVIGDNIWIAFEPAETIPLYSG